MFAIIAWVIPSIILTLGLFYFSFKEVRDLGATVFDILFFFMLLAVFWIPIVNVIILAIFGSEFVHDVVSPWWDRNKHFLDKQVIKPKKV